MNELHAKPDVDFKEFLVPADATAIRCVDERHATRQSRGIQIQGATSGIVDALKMVSFKLKSEDAAWKAIETAGLPIDGHVDSHKGANGCGYNNRVETDPKSVGVHEAVSAASRLARVNPARVLHYEGDHNPKHATINFVPNTTFDSDRLLASSAGTFNLDAWALLSMATKLGLSHDESARFVTHIVDSYKQTVTTLTNSAITTFDEIR